MAERDAEIGEQRRAAHACGTGDDQQWGQVRTSGELGYRVHGHECLHGEIVLGADRLRGTNFIVAGAGEGFTLPGRIAAQVYSGKRPGVLGQKAARG
ncbi:hypothetical protein GCM10022222_83670 [Amycolatopsis ultiminotia]|uniref:Uncharacterized protein n=1 Tax=Amycolatopsis ultiminotia TaxID=543629 RepID=A0ABP6YNF6_9PSEU